MFTNEGKREEDEINRLLDKMVNVGLTDDEKKLLSDLSNGKKLDDPVLAKHKTGGLLFDDDGNVVTKEPKQPKEGDEFITKKGKQSPSAGKSRFEDKPTNIRVYRLKNSEERFYYIFNDKELMVYRTGGKNMFGSFLSKESDYYKKISILSPDELWKQLDWAFDIGMELDKKTADEVGLFSDLYFEDIRKNEKYLAMTYKKLSTLL
jgi:hypothetical protein